MQTLLKKDKVATLAVIRLVATGFRNFLTIGRTLLLEPTRSAFIASLHITHTNTKLLLCSSLLLSSPSFIGSRSSGSNRSGNKAGALETKSGGSGSETEKREKALSERSAAPPSEHSIHSTHSTLSQGQNSSYGPPAAAAPGSPPGRDLASVPPELTASRQSFRMAMGNPSEFFVDVM